ncbi:MAG: zinc ribbon domain-containing protein [Spirochaetaceae bacterium]|nr:zinc ribbon domain-containing protein [Spirochaetaceae bacterium]
MPFCSECGKNYQDSANFCPYCGTPNSLSSGSNQTNIVENGSDTTSPSAFQSY